ncbi:phosphoadenylyl-sulfate reductase [uncultured Rhodoblastus sp.]|uniref:phosphoadenylyl-sulfate reductase n=1 Tax=uncultured Rhodoblastus sp. TaxID=543037 RepID=UPI0026015EA4|nr:phosphoadenylyl-sulfate reductase [uncultured Rhodoblastus sp.]
MSEVLRKAADRLNDAFAAATLAERLRLLRNSTGGRIVFTTSFGIEDQAITHALGVEKIDVEIVTLDTGRLFPETYDVWAHTEVRYGLRIGGFYPDAIALQQLVARQGINGFYDSLEARKACCESRKVEPLARALAGAKVWIAGLRADQSAHRAGARFVEFDETRGLIKASPLLDFSRDEVAEFCLTNDAPTNVLHQRGFVSIGCAPCTRAIQPGEPERAGRWWWEDEAKKECGLHIGADGKISRATEAA